MFEAIAAIAIIIYVIGSQLRGEPIRGKRLILLPPVLTHLAGAEMAAGAATILFALGINRLAQALVVGGRAWLAGIPFAPEQDGRVFLAEIFH